MSRKQDMTIVNNNGGRLPRAIILAQSLGNFLKSAPFFLVHPPPPVIRKAVIRNPATQKDQEKQQKTTKYVEITRKN